MEEGKEMIHSKTHHQLLFPSLIYFFFYVLHQIYASTKPRANKLVINRKEKINKAHRRKKTKQKKERQVNLGSRKREDSISSSQLSTNVFVIESIKDLLQKQESSTPVPNHLVGPKFCAQILCPNFAKNSLKRRKLWETRTLKN